MYVINATSKVPIFQINQHIGDDKDVTNEDGTITQGDGMGIDGKVFANEVLSFNDSDISKLLFYVNSQGGNVQDSLDMFNSISMSSKRTHSVITGFAFSCAGWIPMGADKVDMVRETGRWMCHMPYNPENPEEKSVFMDNVVDIISRVMASKSGRNGKPKKDQEFFINLMKEQTWWDAERMFEEGLIDNIVDAKGKVIKLEKEIVTLNSSELSYFYKENQIFQNKLIIENREFDTEERDNLAKEGKALPDGSFPISDEQDLKNAIHAIGRAKDPEKAKAHIKKRAKELNLTSLIPDSWNNFKNNNSMKFPKIVNRLNAIDKTKTGIGFNITEDSDEEVFVDALSRLENRLRALNDDMMDKEKIVLDEKKLGEELKNKLDAKEKEMIEAKKAADNAAKEHAEMKTAFDKMQSENKAMCEEKVAAENAAKESANLLKREKAVNYVETLVTTGRIKATEDMNIDEAKTYWVNKATENFTDVQALFAAVPITHKAPKQGEKISDTRFNNGTEMAATDLKKLIAANSNLIKEKRIRTENGVRINMYTGKVVN